MALRMQPHVLVRICDHAPSHVTPPSHM
ncbi:hypothetical protein FAIPA1_20404 [Frankia sp. AiPs1]